MPWLSCPAHPNPAASPCRAQGCSQDFLQPCSASWGILVPLQPLLCLGFAGYLHCLAFRLFGCCQNSSAPESCVFSCLLHLVEMLLCREGVSWCWGYLSVRAVGCW